MYFKTQLAQSVWESKYRYNNETEDQTIERMVKYVSKIEKGYIQYYKDKDLNNLSDYGKSLFGSILFDNEVIDSVIFDLLKDYEKFIPGGSIIASLGTPKKASLSNCYVIDSPEDNISSIYDTVKSMANLFKRRSGCGVDLSKLRPRGAIVNNSASTSTGSVSFLDIFSANAQVVGADGRRAAQMISLSDRHPDVEEFIKVKSDLSKIPGANLSVMISRELVDKAKANQDWLLTFPVDDFELQYITPETLPYNELICISKNRYVKKVKAKELFDLIIEMAHKYAEPGLLLKDNLLKYDPASVYDELRMISTNPCGEQPLSAKDSCRLGSVNLYSFVKNKFRKNASFDYNKYYETVYNAILFMDNVIDAEIEYLQRIKADANDKSEEDLWDAVIKIAQKGRRIGVGFTALGDTIASMGLSFKESDDLVKKIMDVKMRAELDATIDLGYLKGSFGLFDLNKEYPDNIPANDFYANMLKYYPDQIDRMKRLNTRRNVSTSTVAPSGSLSIIASRQGTTSGIEPLFKALYTRRRKVNATDKCDFVDPHTGERFIEFFVAHSGLIDFCKIKYDKDFNDLSKEEQIAVFNSSPYKDNEAESIHWEDRLRIQGIIQDRTSSAISTTINLHEKVDKSVVYNIYVNAYESGLKGCTIYRDKSRSGILVTESKPDYKMIKHSAPKRPQILPCDIHSIRQKGGDYICAVGLMDNIPYEIFVFESEKCDHSKGFIKKVKSGHYALLDINKNVIIDNMSKVMLPAMEDLTRGYSYGLRHSGQIKFAVEQLQKSQGNLSDFSKVLARTLKKYIENGESSSETCSKCGEKLVFEDGCKTCKNCGESYCG